MIRLNLGSGAIPLPGYFNLDINQDNPVYPLPYPDESIDEIRASHILEHFGVTESMDVICEWHRCLKTGGTLKIAVPDIDKIQEYRDDPMYELFVMGGQTDQYDYHKSLWWREKLIKIFTCLGYTDLLEWRSEITDCASLPISLNLKGTKSGKA